MAIFRQRGKLWLESEAASFTNADKQVVYTGVGHGNTFIKMAAKHPSFVIP